jgi:hypothetical protein
LEKDVATHPGQRPKRKDYLSKSGFEFALMSWQTMADLYRHDKEQERQERQAQRQREREARAAEARAARQQQRRRSTPTKGEWFEKYRSSENRDTGIPQTDLQFGYKGTKGGHIAVSGETGETLFVRDVDGTVLYDHNTDEGGYDNIK